MRYGLWSQILDCQIAEYPKTGLEKLLEDDEEIEFSSDASNKIEAEFNNYISMPKVVLNENPPKWWKLSEFPIVKIFAKNI